MRYIGIDPGKNGGIAVLDADGQVFSAVKMPETEGDLLQHLQERNWGPGSGGTRAVLEAVNAGVFGGGKSGRMGVVSAFTFGRGYGSLRMALIAANIPFDEVRPQKWQEVIGCRTKGDKNVSKRRAQELFPNLKITHATADALLLAEYCRRLEVRA